MSDIVLFFYIADVGLLTREVAKKAKKLILNTEQRLQTQFKS